MFQLGATAHLSYPELKAGPCASAAHSQKLEMRISGDRFFLSAIRNMESGKRQLPPPKLEKEVDLDANLEG
jgi:hypothetical protein